jgi:hypothetical protein
VVALLETIEVLLFITTPNGEMEPSNEEVTGHIYQWQIMELMVDEMEPVMVERNEMMVMALVLRHQLQMTNVALDYPSRVVMPFYHSVSS